MAEHFNYWSQEIMRHVPVVTSIGLTMSALFGIGWFAKHSKDIGLLSLVCAAYAITPFIPHWS